MGPADATLHLVLDKTLKPMDFRVLFYLLATHDPRTGRITRRQVDACTDLHHAAPTISLSFRRLTHGGYLIADSDGYLLHPDIRSLPAAPAPPPNLNDPHLPRPRLPSDNPTARHRTPNRT